MRGLDDLIALRQRRMAPSSVVLYLGPRSLPSDAAFLVGRGEPGDLRALVGLRVVIVGAHHEREKVLRWCQAAEDAGALIVMGYATDSARLTRETPVFAGGNEAELRRRIEDLGARNGAFAA